MEFIKYCIDILLQIIGAWGYPGIVILMALESSLLPIPSEVVMIPAGYLAAQGKMDLTILLFCSTLGGVMGAWINYFLAFYFGRPIFVKYGKYVGMTEHHLEKVETFFYRHGEISTFVGRLLPVIRHLAAIPAGFARMSLWKLSFYTAIGAGLWTTVLLAIGYFASANPDLQHDLLAKSSTYLIGGLLLIVGGYILYQKNNTFGTHRISVLDDYADLLDTEPRQVIISTHEHIGKKDILCLITDAKEQEFLISKRVKAISSAHILHILEKEKVSQRVVEVVLKSIQDEENNNRFFLDANIYLLQPLSKDK